MRVKQGKPRVVGSAMTIDHFNTDLIGGAAVAALRLHHGLLGSGMDSRFWYRPSNEHAEYEQIAGTGSGIQAVGQAIKNPRAFGNVASFLRKCLLKLRYRRALRNRPGGFEVFSSPFVEPATRWDPAKL